MKVPDNRQRFNEAIARIKAKHIAQFGSARGYVKKMAWRIDMSQGNLNSIISGGGQISDHTLAKVLDFAALNEPFSYATFRQWFPIETAPKDCRIFIALRVADGREDLLYWVKPNFRMYVAPYSIVRIEDYKCWRYNLSHPP